MPDELANRIEAYLLAAKGWVNAEDLCQAFDVTRRDLRARGSKPGLCSDYAISGDRGFRHVNSATEKEFEEAIGRMRRHALGELLRIRRLRARRAARPVLTFEAGTNQALLLTQL